MELTEKPLVPESDNSHLQTEDNASPKERFLKDTPEVRHSPPEGGWGWLCVLGRFYAHFMIIGSMSAFGIIYIELIDYYHTNRTDTAWVGSLAAGLSMLMGPVSGMVTQRLGCRATTIIGALIAAFGIFISWFANGIIYLCLTYGVIAGCGLGLSFVPPAVIIFQYFEKKRGFASAIGSTGGGMGSMVLPVLYAELVKTFGWRGSMWIISGLMLNVVVCGMLFRTPDYLKKHKSSDQTKDNKTTLRGFAVFQDFFSVFKNPGFVMFFLGTLFCYFGYGVPLVHMPDLAYQRGVARDQVAYLLSIKGFTSVLLRVPVAWVSDFRYVSRSLILSILLLVCGVGTMVCPHLNSFEAFAVYSAVQGGCMGIWAAFMSVILADMVGLKAINKALGFVLFSGGFATIVSSPLAGWMYDITRSYVASFYFAGIVYLISGLLTLATFITGYCKRNRDIQHKGP